MAEQGAARTRAYVKRLKKAVAPTSTVDVQEVEQPSSTIPSPIRYPPVRKLTNPELLKLETNWQLEQLDKVKNANTGSDGSVLPVPEHTTLCERFLKLESTPHPVSMELQIFYQQLTTGCLGHDQILRNDAHLAMKTDPTVQQLLQNLVTFIAEGVRVNVAKQCMANTINLTLMMGSLLENVHVNLRSEMHQILPMLITCLVSKNHSDHVNDWEVRDYSAQLLTRLCEKEKQLIAKMEPKIVEVLCSRVRDKNVPLTTLYGILAGIEALGMSAIKEFISEYIIDIGKRLHGILEKVGPLEDNQACERIKEKLLKMIHPMFQELRAPPSYAISLEEFIKKFGSSCPSD